MIYDKQQEYYNWLKQSNIPPMTNTQHQFAQMLFEKDNFEKDNFELLQKVGNLDDIYHSIRKYLKP